MHMRRTVHRAMPALAVAGPLRSVVPDEKRAGRWIKQMNRLEVREVR